MSSASAQSALRPIIVGTAGHIDHGKTKLVKALTGIDADRLAEEKRRGITIDLGFAHLELPAPGGGVLRLGFVDVPGHERFVRNMLAGAGGVDLLLFVVAADEGIKPQTREHFDICRLLAVRRGMTVLTKRDLVDAETLAVVRAEVADFLRGSFLDSDSAPIVAISSKTGAGLEELKAELARVASEITPKDSSTYFRLPIDRVFSMKGFGTVVTGTLISGRVRKDDEVEIFPQRAKARVRGVQVHGSAAEEAVAGERTALNLSGDSVSTADLARGMMLAETGFFRPTHELDVSLSLLESARPLRNHARMHLHAYAAETIAEVSLHGEKELKPGSQGFARLRLARLLLALPGDRFIIRQFSPVVTIGGGVVLNATITGKAAAPEFLQILEKGSPEQILMARVERRGLAGLTMSAAVTETGWRRERLHILADVLLAQGRILLHGEVLVTSESFALLKQEMQSRIADFHQRHPLVPGISKEELRTSLGASTEVLAAALDALLAEKRLEISGDRVRAAGRQIVMKDEEAESKRVIEQAFSAAGLSVPALKDVLAGLKVDKQRAQRLVTLLLREKTLVKLSDDLVFHREALEQLRRSLATQKNVSPKIDVARFKELTGVSRKYAIPLLEYLDRERVTRRVGDERVIL
jgi:selenocysteine-specific elongation factor